MQDIEPEAQRLRQAYPKVFGGEERVHPSRWLSRPEVSRLLGACHDGTWTGSRNQLIIRLGLHGLRASDITGLTWDMRQPDGTWAWTGKQNRRRVLVLGPTLSDQLDRWEKVYRIAMRQPLEPHMPIIVSSQGGKSLLWGRPIGYEAVRIAVVRMGQRAGLGHVCPHDLRRTMAHLLNEERSADGGHKFGLVEIQRALGHSSPVITERSYLAPMTKNDLTRSSAVIDV